MSAIPTRSTTGCFTCKTKRKKCDETKPHCLRCQKSNLECPGYIYIEHPTQPTRKLRTLLAPRTLAGRSRVTEHQGTPSVNAEETVMPPQSQLSINQEMDLQPSHHGPGTSMMANAGTTSEAVDMSNPWVSLSSFSGSLEHPPHRPVGFDALHGFTLGGANLDSVVMLPDRRDSTPMSSGQASLLGALFSLGQPPDPLSKHPRPDTDLSSKPYTSLVSNRSPSSIEEQVDADTPDDDDPEGVVSIICSTPVLDKTAEANALPFVLQNYATWIRRMAFEPLKTVRVVREFVFSHFEDRNSRWILTLLAIIGGKIGNMDISEGKHEHMLSALQYAVQKRLEIVKSHPNPNEPELIKALDSAIEMILINFFVSPINDVVVLRQEAASIFRQLCPEPPGLPINLPALLHRPPICLRNYAHIDVLFSVVMDMPTLFRYHTTIPDSQPPNLYEPILGNQSDSGLQWLHGTPDPLVILFAKMKDMRGDGSTPNAEMTTSFEREIRELQPSSSPSSESFLVIMRFVVQECWRQVAYIYLYMALCGDSSDTPRVKRVLKDFMKLLRSMKPGRLPDEFLVMNLILVAPAIHQKHDREIIRQRILGIYSRGRTANNNLLCVIEDYWARADAVGRPVVWADVAVSRIRILGV